MQQLVAIGQPHTTIVCRYYAIDAFVCQLVIPIFRLDDNRAYPIILFAKDIRPLFRAKPDLSVAWQLRHAQHVIAAQKMRILPVAAE